MYAVIFKAEIAELDDEYASMAARMRELARSRYGCVEFTSCTQGSMEIAISYWETQDQIRQWKQNAEHLVAQDRGRSKWYRAYTVEVMELVRAYHSVVSTPE
jgi:heme-degrading monooxygenase HmoA